MGGSLAALVHGNRTLPAWNLFPRAGMTFIVGGEAGNVEQRRSRALVSQQ